MYYIYNFVTDQESYYQESVPRKQALKTTYAINHNMGSRLATEFGKLMDELEEKIIDVGKFWTLDDYTVKKEIYAD